MTPVTYDDIVEIRTHDPARIARAVRQRRRPALEKNRKLLIIAADHPARGALAAGPRALAMADRRELVSRVAEALNRPGVDGFLGTADLVEELALLGALEGKLVYGSMNRGGLAGASFEIDDRFTGYDAAGIADAGLDGGKMLLRIDHEDPASVATLEACAHAVDDLARHGLVAMVEPFLSRRVDGRVRNVLSPDAVITSIAIASGLGRTSAYTWLKLPVVDEMERVMASTTMPSLILGGEVSDDAESALAAWAKAVSIPTVKGLIIGRSLLFPPDDDVATAVDAAAGLL